MMEGVRRRPPCLQRGLQGGPEALPLVHRHTGESQERGQAGLPARARCYQPMRRLPSLEGSRTIKRDKLKRYHSIVPADVRLHPHP